MPRSATLAAVEIDVQPEARTLELVPEPEPFRILIAGDFSGGVGRNRRPVAIDRDNFDRVMALLSPELRVESGGAQVPITFRELDDFHPDNLLQRLAPFEGLRDLRKRVAEGSVRPAPEIGNASGAELLRMMTGGAAPAREKPQLSAWEQMLREITAGHTESAPDPRQGQWLAQVDQAIGAEMRTLMHHAPFQALEAAWRGLYLLVRRVETGENLTIHLLDLPQAELEAGGLGDLRRAMEQESWGVVAGLYSFSAGDESTLARIAGMSQEARAPFIAGVAPGIMAADGAFESLRGSLKAEWVGLATPRLLLRLPYGKSTAETESFPFEEMPAPPEHEHYLWGNPALACTLLLAKAFERDGWSMRPAGGEIEELPAHVYQRNGEAELQPCAEFWLTEDAAAMRMERGFMPLVSIKGTDRARLLRFQSVAKSGAPLAGKWD